MKNIAAIALLSSIALVSCKKETAKITKVDPKTGKTVTVEVPADSVAKVAENPAIRDSAGIVTQTFKLEKGKTYPLTTLPERCKNNDGSSGKIYHCNSESTDEMNFTVNDIKGNVYEMTLNLVSKRSSQSAQGKTVVVDTKQLFRKKMTLK
jgi:hypothetical protein